jgi:hypothetical protein
MMEWTSGSPGVKTPLDLFLAAILHLRVAWADVLGKSKGWALHSSWGTVSKEDITLRGNLTV